MPPSSKQRKRKIPEAAYEPRGEACIMLRVNHTLYRRIWREADRQGVSMNKLVSAIVADYFGLTKA